MSFRVLTAAQNDFFYKYGYLHLTSFVPDDLLNNVQLPIDKWVNRVIHRWMKKGLINSNFADVPFDRRLFQAWEAANRPLYKECITQEIASQEIFNFLTYPKFVSLVQDLLGGDNIQALAGYMCRPKLPSSVFPIDTPWHQDAQCSLYHGTNEVNFLTIWIPFMDVDESNSCLQVSEGSHISTKVFDDAKNGAIHYSIHPKHSDKFINLRSIPMKRGDILCLHQRVAHRALPNSTNKMRWSMDIRYERFIGSDAPTPKRGFVCGHEDPSKVEKVYEKCFQDLWTFFDQSSHNNQTDQIG